MSTKKLLRPTNGRIRLAVGLGLLGLICVQCTRPTEAFRESQHVSSIAGESVGTVSGATANQILTLAKYDQIALLKLCLERYDANVQDFSCTFVKQERINGKVNPEQWISVKFLDHPFSVAMHWTRNAPIGDRLLYIEGQNDGNMLVKPKGMLGGLVGTVQRKPDGPEAMANTLRPVTLFGFRRSTESMIHVYELARKNGDLKCEFKGFADVDGREALVLERTLPPKDAYPSNRTVIYVDKELLLPICVESYDWDGQLQSRYVFKDLKINIGLKTADFTPAVNGL